MVASTFVLFVGLLSIVKKSVRADKKRSSLYLSGDRRIIYDVVDGVVALSISCHRYHGSIGKRHHY